MPIGIGLCEPIAAGVIGGGRRVAGRINDVGNVVVGVVVELGLSIQSIGAA